MFRGSLSLPQFKMTKSKNIEYKNGMKFSCGPPIRAGAYKKWNWCRLCQSIYEKHIYRCVDCKQMLRASSKGNKNYITKVEREANRREVIRDLQRKL